MASTIPGVSFACQGPADGSARSALITPRRKLYGNERLPIKFATKVPTKGPETALETSSIKEQTTPTTGVATVRMNLIWGSSRSLSWGLNLPWKLSPHLELSLYGTGLDPTERANCVRRASRLLPTQAPGVARPG